MRADFGVDLFPNHRNQPRNSELKKPVQRGFIEATLPRCTARPCRFGRAGRPRCPHFTGMVSEKTLCAAYPNIILS
jgi:hypothetical protein